MKPLLYIFVKAPRLGQVKTRLAADIGHVHARRVYRSMTAKIIREMRSRKWTSVLYGTDGGAPWRQHDPQQTPHCHFGGLWPRDMAWQTQCSGGLSERTALLFQHKRPVIAIGSDTPTMRRQDIADGFAALKTHDAVLGPASDGGFWLIGLKIAARADLFDEVRWSHPETMTDMFDSLNCKTALLRTLTDVDDLAAYKGAGSNAPKPV